MIGADQVVVEEDEAEVVATTIHLPGVVGIFHEWLQILLADRNGGQHVA